MICIEVAPWCRGNAETYARINRSRIIEGSGVDSDWIVPVIGIIAVMDGAGKTNVFAAYRIPIIAWKREKAVAGIACNGGFLRIN